MSITFDIDAPDLAGEWRVRAIPWDRYVEEVLELYRPPLRAPATHAQMKHCLELAGSIRDEAGELMLRTTGDLSVRVIARLVATRPAELFPVLDGGHAAVHPVRRQHGREDRPAARLAVRHPPGRELGPDREAARQEAPDPRRGPRHPRCAGERRRDAPRLGEMEGETSSSPGHSVRVRGLERLRGPPSGGRRPRPSRADHPRAPEGQPPAEDRAPPPHPYRCRWRRSRSSSRGSRGDSTPPRASRCRSVPGCSRAAVAAARGRTARRVRSLSTPSRPSRGGPGWRTRRSRRCGAGWRLICGSSGWGAARWRACFAIARPSMSCSTRVTTSRIFANRWPIWNTDHAPLRTRPLDPLPVGPGSPPGRRRRAPSIAPMPTSPRPCASSMAGRSGM